MAVAISLLFSIPRSNPLIICRCFTLGLTACSRGNLPGFCQAAGWGGKDLLNAPVQPCSVGCCGTGGCEEGRACWSSTPSWEGTATVPGLVTCVPSLADGSGCCQGSAPPVCPPQPAQLQACSGNMEQPLCSPRASTKVLLQDRKNFG